MDVFREVLTDRKAIFFNSAGCVGDWEKDEIVTTCGSDFGSLNYRIGHVAMFAPGKRKT